jgi:hypothetical protein
MRQNSEIKNNNIYFGSTSFYYFFCPSFILIKTMVGYSNKTYKKKDEEDVRQFLSEKLNRSIGNGPLQPLLSDGILLCE